METNHVTVAENIGRTVVEYDTRAKKWKGAKMDLKHGLGE